MARKLEKEARKEEDAAEDQKEKERLHQRRVDLQRLERVEQLYVSTLLLKRAPNAFH